MLSAQMAQYPCDTQSNLRVSLFLHRKGHGNMHNLDIYLSTISTVHAWVGVNSFFAHDAIIVWHAAWNHSILEEQYAQVDQDSTDVCAPVLVY